MNIRSAQKDDFNPKARAFIILLAPVLAVILFCVIMYRYTIN
jgi:hypothetical protein